MKMLQSSVNRSGDSMKSEYRKNYMIYYTQQITASIASILITGSVLQSFLLECGCSENSVSIYVSVMQGVQVLAMLILAKKVENIKNIFTQYASTYFLQILLFIVMIYLSIRHTEPVSRKYLYLFVISLIVSLFQGINAVLGYKLPYYIIDMKHYGRLSGITGVVLGIVGVLFSGALSYFVGKYPYFKVMTVFCGIGLILTTVTGILIKNYDNKYKENFSDKKTDSINIFKYKPFYQLLIPNLCRGISNGIFVLMATIGYTKGILNSSGTGIMVTISQIATIVGCFLYTVLAGRVSEGKIVLGSGILFCGIIPFSFMGNSQNMFLGIYLITFLFYVIVNYAIPVLIARRIDYRCIGQYSAWRMVIHMGGTAVGNALVPILLKTVGGTGSLIVCGILLVLCTFYYYRFEKQNGSF